MNNKRTSSLSSTKVPQKNLLENSNSKNGRSNASTNNKRESSREEGHIHAAKPPKRRSSATANEAKTVSSGSSSSSRVNIGNNKNKNPEKSSSSSRNTIKINQVNNPDNGSNEPSKPTSKSIIKTINHNVNVTLKGSGRSRFVVYAGEKYKIDDFVYIASEIPSEPYIIGRIMDFFVDTKTNKPKARFGLYYRARDVSNAKKRFDHRCLIGTMHSETQLVTALRGKCIVKHLYELDEDLTLYKEQEDHFFFEQFFDRYTHTLYDAVLVSSLEEYLPPIVKSRLQYYKYVIVEIGKGRDYLDPRNCNVCNRWTMISDGIKCVTCNETYHLGCVYLPKKISKGYSWECPYCLKFALGEKVESQHVSYEEAGSNPSTDSALEIPVAQTAYNDLDVDLNSIEEKTDFFPEWPFFYLGEHTKYADILGKFYRSKGYPKSASRIGRSYQATVPDSVEASLNSANLSSAQASDEELILLSANQTSTTQKKKSSSSSSSKKKKMKLTIDFEEILFRGTSQETIFKKPNSMSDENLQNYVHKVLEMKPIEVNQKTDVYDVALSSLATHGYVFENALLHIDRLNNQGMGIVNWTQKEINQFEEGITLYGHELHLVKKKIPTKTVREVVLYFYQWKKSDRYPFVYGEYCKKYRPLKKFKNTQQDHDTNIENVRPDRWFDAFTLERSGLRCKCTICEVEESESWSVREVFEQKPEIYCEACGLYWFKYAYARMDPTNERRSRDERRRRKQLEEGRSNANYVNSNKKVKDEKTIPVCAVCRSGFDAPGSHFSMHSCTGCKLQVHRICYGLPESLYTHFECSRCSNIKDPVSSLIYTCLLCYKDIPDHLSALKKTIGNNWVHLTCAAWTPGITFGDPRFMNMVQNMSRIPTECWEEACFICGNDEGACIKCANDYCQLYTHVYCAQEDGWELVFQPSSNFHRNTPEEIKGNKSSAHPLQVLCPGHRKTKRRDNGFKPTLFHEWMTSHVMSEATSESKDDSLNSNHDLRTLPAGAQRAVSNNLISQCTCHVTRKDKKEKKSSSKSSKSDGENESPTCLNCESNISPFWWRKKDIIYKFQNETQKSVNLDKMAENQVCCHRCALTSVVD